MRWKKDSSELRGIGSSNLKQIDDAMEQLEESIVTVILVAMKDVWEALKEEEKAGNPNTYFQKCSNKFYDVAKQFYADDEYTNRTKSVLHYNPDMLVGLCEIQAAISMWRAYGQDRASPDPTKKIKIMQSIVQICIYSSPQYFHDEGRELNEISEEIEERLKKVRGKIKALESNSKDTGRLQELQVEEKDLMSKMEQIVERRGILDRLMDAPSIVSLDAHITPITLQLAKLKSLGDS